MKFTIIFETMKENGKLADFIGKAGLDILDILRKDYPIVNTLPIKDIHVDSSCPLNGCRLEKNIPEDYARRSKHFGGDTIVIVKVPNFFLSRFIKWDITQINKTKEVSFMYFWTKKIRIPNYIKCDQKLDMNAVFNAWEEDGFPLKWSI